MRFLAVFAICLTIAGCGPLTFSGAESDDTIAAQDGAYAMRLPDGWSVKQRSTEAGSRVILVANKDAAAGKGYPQVAVREVRQPMPQAVLELMARDKTLEFSELWKGPRDKYQLKQSVLDGGGTRFSYWLSPLDGQGVEYYGLIVLTAFGRLELTGMAQAGTAQRYLKDFNAVFAALELEPRARFVPGKAGDAGAWLRGVYMDAVTREQDALRRLSGETAALAGSSPALNAQEKGFLNGTFGRAATKALDASAGMTRALEAGKGRDAATALWQFAERADEAATDMDTVALNIRDPKARDGVEKCAARARKLAALGREGSRLPQ